jgi:large subunit ribosomal protein L7Ae
MPKGRRPRESNGPGPGCHEEKKAKKMARHLDEKKTKDFSTGQEIQPQRDLICSVKWLHSVQLPQQRVLLYRWLKVPPVINQPT